MRRRLAARDTRIEDRYSQDLRILAVVNDTARHTTGGSPSGDVPSHSMSRAIHARSALELEGAGMGSPTPVDPARTAMLARRAAAARRRGVLVAVLLSVTVFTAVLGSVSPVPWWVALIPASLCVTVMVLGRRAVVAQQRADRAWERRNRERSRPTGQTRRREQTPQKRNWRPVLPSTTLHDATATRMCPRQCCPQLKWRMLPPLTAPALPCLPMCAPAGPLPHLPTQAQHQCTRTRVQPWRIGHPSNYLSTNTTRQTPRTSPPTVMVPNAIMRSREHHGRLSPYHHLSTP